MIAALKDCAAWRGASARRTSREARAYINLNG
jgi:hypothetical protein